METAEGVPSMCCCCFSFGRRTSLVNGWKWGDFPGGPVVKNLPSNEGHVGLIPGRGTKIPHAAGQLSLRTTTTEPACRNERSHVPCHN